MFRYAHFYIIFCSDFTELRKIANKNKTSFKTYLWMFFPRVFPGFSQASGNN